MADTATWRRQYQSGFMLLDPAPPSPRSQSTRGARVQKKRPRPPFAHPTLPRTHTTPSPRTSGCSTCPAAGQPQCVVSACSAFEQHHPQKHQHQHAGRWPALPGLRGWPTALPGQEAWEGSSCGAGDAHARCTHRDHLVAVSQAHPLQMWRRLLALAPLALCGDALSPSTTPTDSPQPSQAITTALLRAPTFANSARVASSTALPPAQLRECYAPPWCVQKLTAQAQTLH
jgi:hypothetical protein